MSPQRGSVALRGVQPHLCRSAGWCPSPIGRGVKMQPCPGDEVAGSLGSSVRKVSARTAEGAAVGDPKLRRTVALGTLPCHPPILTRNPGMPRSRVGDTSPPGITDSWGQCPQTLQRLLSQPWPLGSQGPPRTAVVPSVSPCMPSEQLRLSDEPSASRNKEKVPGSRWHRAAMGSESLLACLPHSGATHFLPAPRRAFSFLLRVWQQGGATKEASASRLVFAHREL